MVADAQFTKSRTTNLDSNDKPGGTNEGQICPRPEASHRAARGQNSESGTNLLIQGTKPEVP